MRYPKFLNKSLKVAVTAPSDGITEAGDIERFEYAKDFWGQLSGGVIETDNVRRATLGGSSTPQVRAMEFCEAYKEPKVGLVIAASGGETELLLLNHLGGLEECEPTWFMGYSDNTVLNYYLLTELDTASVYGYNVGIFGSYPLHESLYDNARLLCGEKREFTSYQMYKDGYYEVEYPREPHRMTVPVKWVTASGEAESFSGRAIGGCLDLLVGICGTKFDKTAQFINKYGNDGIVWYLESCDLNSMAVLRGLWQLREADWFKNAKGFVFGRPLIDTEYCGLSFKKAVLEVLGNDLPIIFDADFGHKPPIMPIVSGSFMTVWANDGKGGMSYEFI